MPHEPHALSEARRLALRRLIEAHDALRQAVRIAPVETAGMIECRRAVRDAQAEYDRACELEAQAHA